MTTPIEGFINEVLEDGESLVKAGSAKHRDGKYAIHCDGLAFDRTLLAFRGRGVEFGPAEQAAAVRIIAERRGYDPGEFRIVVAVKAGKARSNPDNSLLRTAIRAARLTPLTLLPPLEQYSKAGVLAAVASNLQAKMAPEATIFLPVNALAAGLNVAKAVISHILRDFEVHGLLLCVTRTYYIRRARQYRFVGVDGLHYTLLA